MHSASSAQPTHMQGHIVEAVLVPTCWLRCLPVTPGGQVTVCFLILFSKAGTLLPILSAQSGAGRAGGLWAFDEMEMWLVIAQNLSSLGTGVPEKPQNHTDSPPSLLQ